MDIPFIGDILQFLQAMWDWVYMGIYDFVHSAFVLATKMLVYSWLSTKLFLASVSYEAFKELIEGLGISQEIHSRYSSIDADIRAALSFFGLPDVLNIIFSAIGTRFVMNFVPIFRG